MQAHQNNYIRIQKLREESTLLDNQIRECLTNLASTRKDVHSIPTTAYPAKQGFPFTYDELLSYARRISKTTMPPPGALNAVPPPTTGGDVTPVLNGPSAAPSAVPTPSATTPVSQIPTSQQTLASNTTLPEPVTWHLNPHAMSMFYPWPEEDRIRAGALSRNQALEEQGIEPRGYDPVAEEERKVREEEEKKKREEEERVAREEAERREREEREKLRIERQKAREREQEAWRKGSISGGVGPAAGSPAEKKEKKQFQFTSIDDMDDDD